MLVVPYDDDDDGAVGDGYVQNKKSQGCLSTSPEK